jgi:hypothetical protein
MFKYLFGLLCLLTLLYISSVRAEDVYVEHHALGSGDPSAAGYEHGYAMPDNLVHVPGYLPGYPTAAIVWPRIVDVACRDDGGKVLCNGYNINQYTAGRGEYLFSNPVMVPPVSAIAPVIEYPVLEIAHKISKPDHKKRRRSSMQCK